MKERVTVTQGMCDHAKLLLKGGANNKTAGKMLGVSSATVSRMRSAGFSVIVFNQNNERRRIEEKDRKAQQAIEKLWQEEKQKTAAQMIGEMAGQMQMVLPGTGPVAQDDNENAAKNDKPAEDKAEKDETRMMRFLGSKFDQLHKDMMLLLDEIRKLPI